MKKRLVIAIAAVLLTVGCSTSRSYEFYPDDSTQSNAKNPQDVGCGHVDLVISGGGLGSPEHIEIGHFCPERKNG